MLVGIGAIVLDGAIIENLVMIGAGSLVPPGKTLNQDIYILDRQKDGSTTE